MKKRHALILLSFLLLSGCTLFGEGDKLSEAIYFHNDNALEISLSRREKTKIISTINSSVFSTRQDDQTFPYTTFQFDLSFKLELENTEKIYHLIVDDGYLLRRNPMLSSTISDEVAKLSAAQIKVFTKAFGIVYEDPDNGIFRENMVVDFDYGFHVPGNVTALLNYSLFFFNLEDYGIKTDPIAGDIFKIYYKGEILTQMIYPSRVDTSRMTILDVRRTRAIVARGSLLGVPGSEDFNFVGDGYSNWVFPEFVVNANRTYETVNAYYGENIYATFRVDDDTERPTIQALFSFMPNEAL